MNAPVARVPRRKVGDVLSRDEDGDLESEVSTIITHNPLSCTAPVELVETEILLFQVPVKPRSHPPKTQKKSISKAM